MEMIQSMFMCMDTAMILSQLLQLPMQKKTHSEGNDEVTRTEGISVRVIRMLSQLAVNFFVERASVFFIKKCIIDIIFD